MNKNIIKWSDVDSILKYHCRGNDKSIDTLNRLFQKNVARLYPELEYIPHRFSTSNIKIKQESWTTKKLDKLRRVHRRTKVFGDDKLPIVIIKYKDRNHIIDGTTRVNKWNKELNRKSHAVYIVEPKTNK